MSIEPFTIAIPQADIDDLHLRLSLTRWPDEVAGSEWRYGSNLNYMKDLMSYWQNTFDWRGQEQQLNTFDHFRTTMNGMKIHFVHARGKGPQPFPLILSHGWPSSFVEMLKLVPRLTNPARYGGDPADAFDVIVPSLPGFGFSDRPPHPEDSKRSHIAALWTRLMSDVLGYSRFGAHGGDVGGGVTTQLGRFHQQHVAGIHVLGVSGGPLGSETVELSERERAYYVEYKRWFMEEGSYGHQQHTKPQTLAYGLNDSPAGLAAWITEKFRAWSDCDGDVERRFSKDELLTNISIYWFTQSINSSFGPYYMLDENAAPGKGKRIEVPTAVAVFPKNIDYPPRELGERVYNLQRWTEMPRGGHFPALEEPDLLAEDLRAFFRPLRTSGA